MHPLSVIDWWCPTYVSVTEPYKNISMKKTLLGSGLEACPSGQFSVNFTTTLEKPFVPSIVQNHLISVTTASTLGHHVYAF